MFLNKNPSSSWVPRADAPTQPEGKCGIFILQPQKMPLAFPVPCGAVTRFYKVQDRDTDLIVKWKDCQDHL